MPPNKMIGRLLQAKSDCVGNEKRGISVRNVLFNAVPTSNRDQICINYHRLTRRTKNGRIFPSPPTSLFLFYKSGGALHRSRNCTFNLFGTYSTRNTPTLLYAVSTSRPTNCTTIDNQKSELQCGFQHKFAMNELEGT